MIKADSANSFFFIGECPIRRYRPDRPRQLIESGDVLPVWACRGVWRGATVRAGLETQPLGCGDT